MGLLINDQKIRKAPSSAKTTDDEVPAPEVPEEHVVISPSGCQDSKSPIVSHNEVSSSAQDPPEELEPSR